VWLDGLSPLEKLGHPRVTLLFSGRQTVGSHSNKGDNCIMSWWEQVTFHWDDDFRFVLYTNTFSWIFIVLAHSPNSLLIEMSLYFDTLSRFRANQTFLLLLLKALCLAEKQQILIVYSLDWPDRSSGEPTIYHTREASTITLTTPLRFC
jgi:hypothetical protein